MERGSFFDVRAERFLPNLTVKRLNGAFFDGLACGHSTESGAFVYLTNWIGFKYNTLLEETEVSSPYVGRVRIPNMTVMRIENAKFTDKGHVFFCEISVYNRTEKKQIKILTTKTLKTVYGKFSRFILFSFGLIN